MTKSSPFLRKPRSPVRRNGPSPSAERRAEEFLRLRGSPPVAACDARARDPDLADAILGAPNAGRGIDDDDAMAGGDLAAADQLLGRGGWACLDDLAASEGLGVDREDDGRADPSGRPKRAASPRPGRSRAGTPRGGIRPGRTRRRSGRASPGGSARRR